MKEFDVTFVWGIFVFLLVFLINYFVIYKIGYKTIKNGKKKKKQKNLESFIGLSYLVPRFKLDLTKANINFLFIICALINAFIISMVFVVICLINWDFPFKILLSFVLLFGLIFSLYELFGRSLVKKGWQKDGNKKN